MHTATPSQIMAMADYIAATRKQRIEDALATFHEFKKPCLIKENGNWHLKEKVRYEQTRSF